MVIVDRDVEIISSLVEFIKITFVLVWVIALVFKVKYIVTVLDVIKAIMDMIV
jgi:hypothetical protein